MLHVVRVDCSNGFRDGVVSLAHSVRRLASIKKMSTPNSKLQHGSLVQPGLDDDTLPSPSAYGHLRVEVHEDAIALVRSNAVLAKNADVFFTPCVEDTRWVFR